MLNSMKDGNNIYVQEEDEDEQYPLVESMNK